MTRARIGIRSSAPARPMLLELPRLRFLFEHLLDRTAAEDRLGLRGGRFAPGVGPLVALLDQEPLLPIPRGTRADQSVGALDLLTEEEDLHVSLLDRLREFHRLAAAGLGDVLEDT